jgi:hypothetical protein
LRCFRPFGTVFAILSFIVAATYVASTTNARETEVPFRSIVPSSWTLAPPEPQSYGRRFVSPSGDAWLWFFAVPTNREATVNSNTDRLAPGPAERPTYEARGGDWLVSSGYRGGNRIFYRRAMLACNGTKWRHIEFEYPASEKRLFDDFVTRTSFALRAYQNVGCEAHKAPAEPAAHRLNRVIRAKLVPASVDANKAPVEPAPVEGVQNDCPRLRICAPGGNPPCEISACIR